LCTALGIRVPFTGLPTDEVFQKFYTGLDNKNQLMIVILDEIDCLARNRENDVLYDLTRIGSQLKNSNLRIIGISNDLNFKQLLDARVLSSLSEEEISFPPYTATEIQDILTERAELAFEPNVIETGVIPYCSAIGARENGDARRAIDLFRVSGEIAERKGEHRVTETHVKEANQQIDRDTVNDAIVTMPIHMKLVLYAIYLQDKFGTEKASTGDIFSVYQNICKETHNEILTQRRVSDLINELDMQGLITARIISKGRYGRTKIISLNVGISNIKNILEKDRLFQLISEKYKSLLS
jgi:cell division control protein 6